MAESPEYLVDYPNATSGGEALWVVAQVSSPSGKAIPGNLLLRFVGGEKVAGFPTNWTIVGAATSLDGAVHCVGMFGELLIFRDGARISTRIICDPPDIRLHGPIRGLTRIYGDLIAFGMGRQILKRVEDQNWLHEAPHILDVARDRVTGINGMCELGGGEMAGVGYGGEIVEFLEDWRIVSSPTNVLLNCIHSSGDAVFAGGILGTLIQREGGGWRVVETGNFTRDIWDIHIFRGKIYLGTSDGLFFLHDGIVAKVDAPVIAEQRRCSKLVGHLGRLWVLGGDRVCVTADGEIWESVEVL